ncbi:MAG: hypothetical protein ABSG34_15760, partial [Candidatus Sulfotelmatobacter sp.]
MRIARFSSGLFLLFLSCSFFAAAQDAPSTQATPDPSASSSTPAPAGQAPAAETAPPPAPATVSTTPVQNTEPAPPAATLNDVLDRVV